MVKGLALPACAEELGSLEGSGSIGISSPLVPPHHTLPFLSAVQQEDGPQLAETTELPQGCMATLLATSFVMAPEPAPPDR